MNKEIEVFFINTFVDNRLKDRIAYELQSKKNRTKAINRFAHSAEDVIKRQCIYKKGQDITLKDLLQVTKSRTCYYISCNNYDGLELDINTAYDICSNEYGASIIILEEAAYVKEETVIGPPFKLILLKEF